MKKKTLDYKRFGKIFIIDINPGNDDVTKDLVMGKLSRIVKNASIYQYVVIIAHSNLVLLKKLVSDVGIKNGFIVSDNGARIYDIITDKIIFEKPMGKDDVAACVHAAIIANLLVLASTSNKEYAYSLNLLNAVSLNKHHYLPLLYTNEFLKFEKYVQTNQIYSILCYFKDHEIIREKSHAFSLMKNDLNISICGSQSNYFTIAGKDISKFNAIIRIMEKTEISSMNSVYYYGVNTIDNSCYSAFRNRLIDMDASIRSPYITKIENQADVDMMVESIKNAFFVDSSASENEYAKRVIFDTKKLEQTINVKTVPKTASDEFMTNEVNKTVE